MCGTLVVVVIGFFVGSDGGKQCRALCEQLGLGCGVGKGMQQMKCGLMACSGDGLGVV